MCRQFAWPLRAVRCLWITGSAFGSSLSNCYLATQSASQTFIQETPIRIPICPLFVEIMPVLSGCVGVCLCIVRGLGERGGGPVPTTQWSSVPSRACSCLPSPMSPTPCKTLTPKTLTLPLSPGWTASLRLVPWGLSPRDKSKEAYPDSQAWVFQLHSQRMKLESTWVSKIHVFLQLWLDSQASSSQPC